MAFAFITPIIYIHCLSRINSQWTTIFYDDGTSSVEWEKAGSATITFNTQSEYCQTGNCIYINGANDGYIRRTVDVSEYISLRLQWSYTTTAEQDGGSYCYVYYSYDTKTRIARYTGDSFVQSFDNIEDLPSAVGQNTLLIYFQVDMSWMGVGLSHDYIPLKCYFDNIYLYGIPEFTNEPTKKPTKQPTKDPTKKPTKQPTKGPTKEPTSNPTKGPTKQPTKGPTKEPTSNPTKGPTKEPTKGPTKEPTSNPTELPTLMPVTDAPTKTDEPTARPSMRPSANPSRRGGQGEASEESPQSSISPPELNVKPNTDLLDNVLLAMGILGALITVGILVGIGKLFCHFSSKRKRAHDDLDHIENGDDQHQVHGVDGGAAQMDDQEDSIGSLYDNKRGKQMQTTTCDTCKTNQDSDSDSILGVGATDKALNEIEGKGEKNVDYSNEGPVDIDDVIDNTDGTKEPQDKNTTRGDTKQTTKGDAIEDV